MKRFAALLLSLLLACALAGCHEKASPATEPATEATTVTTEPTTEVTEPVWTGYTGPTDDYIYYYDEGRNREWEDDVLYFVNSHINDNMLLRNRRFVVNLPGIRTDSANFYNEELHISLLATANELIPRISELTDNEILYRIQMMSAMFRDVHTSAYSGFDRVYPIFFYPFYEEGTFVYYTVVLPRKNEDLLYTRLTAINDIPIEEIAERMRCYDSYENEYGFTLDLGAGGYSYDLLSFPAALEAVGISEIGSTRVKYTLMDDQGNTIDLNLTATKNFDFSRCCGTTPGMALSIPYLYADSINYWYSTSLAEETLYVRIYSFHPNAEYSYMDLSNDLTLEHRATKHYNKVIVDLRGNSGGYQDVGWRSIINTLATMEFDEFYILVDGLTYSNSMIFAAEIDYLVPEVVFVGTPTGEAPGFFAGMYDEDYIMPNCGVQIRIPTAYYQTFEPNEENALIPDVVIWQTLGDYITCRDVVLEYVLAQ